MSSTTRFTKTDGTTANVDITGALSYNNYPTNWVASDIQEVVIGSNVTSIDTGAFYNTINLQSVTFAEDSQCTTIQMQAFHSSNLKNGISLPSSLEQIGAIAFQYCSALQNVTIPDSVTSIGDSAFSYCSALQSVTIGDSVTSIGRGTFNSCKVLQSVTIGNSVTSIGFAAFAYCSALLSMSIPDSVTSIGDFAFQRCSALQSLTIGNSVTSIGTGAFSSCSALQSVTIGDSVTSIGNNAFQGCIALQSVTLPLNNVNFTSIGNSAFEFCIKLQSFNIPNSVTTLGSDVFKSSGLKTLNLTSGNGLRYTTDETNQTIGGKSGVNVNIVSHFQGSLNPPILKGDTVIHNQGDTKIHTFSDRLGQMPPIHEIFPCGPLPRFANWVFDEITGIGQLRLNPGNRDVGDHNIRICHRHIPTSLIDEINYIIRIVNINDPPVFMSAPVKTARQESLYSYTVRTNDIDVGDLVTVTATTKPSWLSFDGTTLSGTPSRSVWGEYRVVLLATDVLGATATQSFTIMVRKPVCFNEGTKILCLKNGEEQYVAVEKICEGDEVKTLKHGYKKITDMRKGTFKLNGLMDMGMYRMKKQGNMIADLEMSGLHCVLVDANDAKYADDIKRQRGLNNKKFYIDGKFRLRANESHEFQQMEQKEYTIYSFALEEQQEQYGIWANGVLVETTKRKNLEVSNMERVKALVKGKNQ